MTCVELQESLAERVDGGNVEQLAHLKICSECSVLVRELLQIASSAAELRAADEPSPRVWNSIEIVLRQEGLIHSPRADRSGRSLIPSFGSRWAWARWLVPAAAVLLVVVGFQLHRQSQSRQIVANPTPPAVHSTDSDVLIAGLNDDDLLQEISAQAPAMRAQYADNLRLANEYIRDAKSVVDANPNDEEARRSLLEAYQQKAMLFELAMDRSLP
jgi:hypothetical protein